MQPYTFTVRTRGYHRPLHAVELIIWLGTTQVGIWPWELLVEVLSQYLTTIQLLQAAEEAVSLPAFAFRKPLAPLADPTKPRLPQAQGRPLRGWSV